MKVSDFDRVARDHFGAVLTNEGFSCAESRRSCFYREVSNDVFHFIMPDISVRGEWYDIRVFANSPRIEPEFVARFPDDLGIPNGQLSYLDPRSGVGPDQKMYRCKTEDGFVRGFKSEVEPALVTKALPFLREINSLADFLPHIRSRFYRGAAMFEIGDLDGGRELLREEQQRLSGINDESGRVGAVLSYIGTRL